MKPRGHNRYFSVTSSCQGQRIEKIQEEAKRKEGKKRKHNLRLVPVRRPDRVSASPVVLLFRSADSLPSSCPLVILFIPRRSFLSSLLPIETTLILLLLLHHASCKTLVPRPGTASDRGCGPECRCHRPAGCSHYRYHDQFLA